MNSTESLVLAADPTLTRTLKISPRKAWKGEQLVRVSSSHKFVYLITEQIKSLTPDKAFVSPTTLKYLEISSVTVEPVKEDLRTIKKISIQPLEEIGNFAGLLVYLKRAMLGWVLGHEEIFEISVLGIKRSFQVFFQEPTEALNDGRPTALTSEEATDGAKDASERGNKASKLEYGVITKSTEMIIHEIAQVQKVSGFTKVGGLSPVIQELISLVKRPLLEPETYAQYGLRPVQGILLFGTPGCGKTLLAQALAEELPETLVRFFKASEIAEAQMIHEAFREVRKIVKESRSHAAGYQGVQSQGYKGAQSSKGYKGALMFIDEIDALAPRREEASEAERRAVAALLTEMEDKTFPIIVLGATNRVNHIDIALRRAGRFEREIEIPVPNEEGRGEILEVLLKTSFPDPGVVKELVGKTDEIARNTQGFVGADLRQLLSRAATKTMEKGESEISMETVLEVARRMRPSSLKALHVEIPRTKFSDIGGYEEAKQQLKEAVEWPLRYDRYFRSLGISPPAGILLYGVPGCSKTMLARAVASESRMNFISVKGPELFNKYVGESEAAVREVFRKAREAAPCVVFFDEIDALGTARGSSESAVSDRVLAQLLTEMDGVGTIVKKSVVVIGATNRPEALDPALLRPGRLDRLVHIGLPDAHAREQIWRGFVARTKSLDANSFDLEAAVRRTQGYTGAECVMVTREAGMLAVREFISIDQQLANQIDRLSLASESKPELAEPLIHWRHIEQALGVVRPRIDFATVAKFEAFAKSHSS